MPILLGAILVGDAFFLIPEKHACSWYVYCRFIWACCMLPCPHLLCMLELVNTSFPSLLSSFWYTSCISWHILRGSCLVQGELGSRNSWCVHCQQGGEIWGDIKGENLVRVSWALHHFAFVRMHFRGSFALLLACSLHRCVEPFASVLRSRCFALYQVALCFAFIWFWATWAFSFFFLFRFYAFSLVFVLFQVTGWWCWQCTHQGGDWEPMDRLQCSPGVMSDCQRAQALRWTGGRWWRPGWTQAQDLDGLRQKSSNGLEAMLDVGRPWLFGTRRGGSATAV